MAEKKKRVAVIITERQEEGLRMAVGLTVLGDTIDIYVMDTLMEKSPLIDMSIEALQQMGGSIYTNSEQNPFAFVSTEEVAGRLVEYDVIIPY